MDFMRGGIREDRVRETEVRSYPVRRLIVPVSLRSDSSESHTCPKSTAGLSSGFDIEAPPQDFSHARRTPLLRTPGSGPFFPAGRRRADAAADSQDAAEN